MATPINAEWTIMIYMNVEPEGFDTSFRKNQLEMSLIGSNDKVQVIILADRNPPRQNSDEEGKEFLFPSIYRIEKDVEIKLDTTPISLIKDEDIGSAEVLEKFLKYCIEYFPAKKYMLSFWDHGTGNSITTSPSLEVIEEAMQMLSFENTSKGTFKSRLFSLMQKAETRRPVGNTFNFPVQANKKIISGNSNNSTFEFIEHGEPDTEQDYLYPKEICTAIHNSFGEEKKIEIIAFDACWMQMFENAYTLKDCAHYMVASENLISLQGFGYYMFLKHFAQKPFATSLEMSMILIKSCYLKISDTVDAPTAKELVKLYYEKIYDDPKMTLSCLDLSATNVLADKIDQLSGLLEKDLESFFESIRIARFLCLTYFDQEDPAGYDLKVIDLVYFLKKLTEILREALDGINANEQDIYTPIIEVSNEIAEAAEMNFVVYKEMGTSMREEKETDKRWGTHGFSIFFPEHVFEWEVYKEAEGWYFENDEKIQMPFALKNRWKKFLIKYFEILKVQI